MQVYDEIAHVGVVDGLLRLCLPGRIGCGVVRIDADDIEPVEVLELGAAELRQFAAEHQMKQLSARALVRHRDNPCTSLELFCRRSVPSVTRSPPVAPAVVQAAVRGAY